MRVSFDLDDTLICHAHGIPCEPRLPFLLRLLIRDEPLRHGTRALVEQLRARGCEVWIYTTSYRNPRAVTRWLRWHGVRVEAVINQEEHDRRHSRSRGCHPPSKNPRRFGIDLHVDDCDGVQMEGQAYGFDVLIVRPNDPDWASRVLEVVDRIQGVQTLSCRRQSAPYRPTEPSV